MRLCNVGAMLFNLRYVIAVVVLGIPDEALMAGVGAIIALVVVLKFLGGKRNEPLRKTVSEVPEAGGVAADQHTGLEDLIDKPSGPTIPSLDTIAEEEDAGMSVDTTSIESFLAKPIDSAPSIGSDAKTDAVGGLDLIKFEDPAHSKTIVPKQKAVVEKPVPSSAKDLRRLREQFGEEFNIDELGDIVAVPEERPSYTPPKDIGEKAEVEANAPRSARLYDREPEKRKENFKRYCMLEFDAGKTPKKVENLLRVKGMSLTEAKQVTFKNYRIWIEKREPLIRDIKETRLLIKRIEYKYLKRQVDAKTRKKTLNDANSKLAVLEAKLKISEDYFA